MVTSIAQKMKIVQQPFLRKDLPDFNVGDTVKMKVKVAEADKVRLHPFEGVVIQKSIRGLNSTFTVRKISFGEGVERIFPLHSPVIESLKVISKGKVKRSKLYYLRKMVGKRGRIKKDQSTEGVLTPSTAPETSTETAATTT